MHKLPYTFHIIEALLEQSNLIGDRGLAQLVHAQGQLCDGWERNRAEIVVVGVYWTGLYCVSLKLCVARIKMGELIAVDKLELAYQLSHAGHHQLDGAHNIG